MDHDADEALDNARELITQYLGQQPHIMKASGVSQDLIDEEGVDVGYTGDDLHPQVYTKVQRKLRELDE